MNKSEKTNDTSTYPDANLYWQKLTVNKTERAAQKNQKPLCIWLTGLSGAGKSTIADLLERRLHAHGCHTYILDGDNIRHRLNGDLGFSDVDRIENIRRVAEVARLMVDAGLIVVVSLISPFRADRAHARSLFESGEFFEVYVDAPLSTCITRDPKGMYAKALGKKISNFTGIDSSYESPDAPDVHLHTNVQLPEECVDLLMGKIKIARNLGCCD